MAKKHGKRSSDSLPHNSLFTQKVEENNIQLSEFKPKDAKVANNIIHKKNWFVYWPDGFSEVKGYVNRNIQINGDKINKGTIVYSLFDHKNFSIKVPCKLEGNSMFYISVIDITYYDECETFTDNGIIMSNEMKECIKHNRKIWIKRNIIQPIENFDN